MSAMKCILWLRGVATTGIPVLRKTGGESEASHSCRAMSCPKGKNKKLMMKKTLIPHPTRRPLGAPAALGSLSPATEKSMHDPTATQARAVTFLRVWGKLMHGGVTCFEQSTQFVSFNHKQMCLFNPSCPPSRVPSRSDCWTDF